MVYARPTRIVITLFAITTQFWTLQAQVNGPRPMGQVDPTATSRPIFHLEILNAGDKPQIVFAADYTDLRRFGVFGPGIWGPSWSPDGTLCAFLGKDSVGRDILDKMNLQKQVTTLFRAESGQRILGRVSWSPDATKIGMILLTPQETGSYRNSLLILDITTGKTLLNAQISAETIHLPSNFAPQNNFRWSPDGRKILVSWENAVVIDVATGKSEVVSAKPSVAEWAPTSDGVYYFEILTPEKDKAWRLGGFYRKELGRSAAIEILPESAVKTFGVTATNIIYGSMVLSPSGADLAIVSGGANPRSSTLRVYELRSGEILALDKPSRTFPLQGLITELEWAPDEKSIAAITLGTSSLQAPKSLPVAIETLDLLTGQWATLDWVDLPSDAVDALADKNLSWTQ